MVRLRALDVGRYASILLKYNSDYSAELKGVYSVCEHMGEYESAINSILEGRPEISRTALDELIAEKLKKVGGGFLTSRGAVHLVAADLGVKVAKSGNITADLKDAQDGAKEISLRTRVMNISPVREFTGKDGSPGAIRTMTVYDNNSRMSVKLWNDKANLPEIDQIRSGDMIKIIKAYVKADLNGSPAINIGSGATLERDENQETDIGGIDILEIDAGAITEDGRNMVISGKIDGQVSDSEFTRKTDGKRGTVLRMSIRGKEGNPIRAVLWGKTKNDIPKFIPTGASVRLIGVDAKSGNQGTEIHGNDATLLEVDGSNDVPPKMVRIISKVDGVSGSMILGADADSNLVFISDTANMTSKFALDDIVELMPTTAFGGSLVLDATSYARRVDASDTKIPMRKDMCTEIGAIKVDKTYVIKAIVLKIDERRDIQTRAGDTISLVEMYVEDSTGPIWVKGWREQSDILAKCQPGEIYEITGLNARAGMEGRIDLMLSPYSSLVRQDS